MLTCRIADDHAPWWVDLRRIDETSIRRVSEVKFIGVGGDPTTPVFDDEDVGTGPAASAAHRKK